MKKKKFSFPKPRDNRNLHDYIPDLGGYDPLGNWHPKDGVVLQPWITFNKKANCGFIYIAVATQNIDTLVVVKFPSSMDRVEFWTRLRHFFEDNEGYTGRLDIIGSMPQKLAEKVCKEYGGQLTFEEYDEFLRGTTFYLNGDFVLTSLTEKRYH